MHKSKRSYHASHIVHYYKDGFPNHREIEKILEQGRYLDLPFAELKEKGFGFEKGSSMPLDLLVEEHEQKSGIIITINGFNIFNSMEDDAALSIVFIRNTYYAFLTADFFDGTKRTVPVYAEKRIYAQPLALQEVLRRAYNGKGKISIEPAII